jgi:hypothetical protein
MTATKQDSGAGQQFCFRKSSIPKDDGGFALSGLDSHNRQQFRNRTFIASQSTTRAKQSRGSETASRFSMRTELLPIGSGHLGLCQEREPGAF